MDVIHFIKEGTVFSTLRISLLALLLSGHSLRSDTGLSVIKMTFSVKNLLITDANNKLTLSGWTLTSVSPLCSISFTQWTTIDSVIGEVWT